VDAHVLKAGDQHLEGKGKLFKIGVCAEIRSNAGWSPFGGSLGSLWVFAGMPVTS
jgi:hypothetical protein